MINDVVIPTTAAFTIYDSEKVPIGNLPSAESRKLDYLLTLADGSKPKISIIQWIVEADTELPNGKTIKKDMSKITIQIDNWPNSNGNSTGFLIMKFEIEAQTLDGKSSAQVDDKGVNLLLLGLGGVYSNEYNVWPTSSTGSPTTKKAQANKDDSVPGKIVITLKMEMGVKFEYDPDTGTNKDAENQAAADSSSQSVSGSMSANASSMSEASNNLTISQQASTSSSTTPSAPSAPTPTPTDPDGGVKEDNWNKWTD